MSCPAVYMALGLMPVAYALFRWMFPVDQVDSSKCKDKKGKLPKQKRQKRSGRAPGKRPASENIDELLDTVQECESNM